MKLAIVALCVAIAMEANASEQFYRVKGRVLCGTQPASDANITFYDENTLRRDTILQQGKPDAQGYFDFSGSTTDPFGSIDPYIKIHHHCKNNAWTILPCVRKTYKELPQSFIDNRQGYDIGTINLMSETSESDCV